MKEIRDILRAYEKASARKLETAIATVVKVEGSSYRQAGARMLVTEEGEITGAISGGCLEGDALTKALLAIDQKTNKLVTYDTSEESDQAFTIQLGCNGVVHILFEYIDSGNTQNPVEILKQLAAVREEAVVVTLFSEHRHQRQEGTVLCYRKGSVFSKDDRFVSGVAEAAKNVLQSGQTKIASVSVKGELMNALTEYVPQAVRLVVVGAGNDTIPLVKAASLIGWEVIVADGRATHASKNRFPDADAVWVLEADKLSGQLLTDRRTLFALMTHNYRYDLTVLEAVLATETPYIGVLGPKTKLIRMISELENKGVVLGEDSLSRIYGPIGLDIGAETSEEIAMAVVAEMKAVVSGKKGTPLREKKEKIHSDTVV